MFRQSIKKVLLYSFSTLLTAIFMVSCNGVNNEQNQLIQEQKEVEVIILKKDSATIINSYPATIEGKNNIEIRPQVSGYIDKIFIEEGQYVTAGKILFNINAGTLIQDKNQAIAALQTAKSQLISAQLDLEKYQNLSQNKVVTDFQYKKAKSAYDAAKSVVNQQESLIASINISLSFTHIKAPISGYVGRLPQKMGALVSPSDAVALTTLSEVNTIYAYFSLSETDMLAINKAKSGNNLQEKLKTFDQVELQLADGTIYPNKGKVDMIDGQYDEQTASIAVRASFQNPTHSLRSGNKGKIILHSLSYDVFKIPVLATYELQDKIIIGKLNAKNEVEYITLKDYTKSGDFYIVKGGFNNGDKIVAQELGQIPEKSIVKIKTK